MPSATPPPLPPALPEGLEDLATLALDLRWTWTYEADELWARLGPDVWALTRNPWVILQTTPRGKLEALARHPGFREALRAQVRAYEDALDAPGWFQAAHPAAPLTSVAYFSMEFGLSDALPIYSGGLGVLAGDHLKAASDLGVPLSAVGLLYDRGYFRQYLDAEGAQIELYPSNERSQLPVVPLRSEEGEWLRLKTRLPGRDLWLRTWEARVGRVRLYLLDSNDPLNVPADRGITSELYGGGPELRLQQELVLGIVGWRLLRTLGLRPEVCHLNEGHAAFALLERARDFMEASGCSFHEALAATRAGNVFTTHTPVVAGFDRFPPGLVEKYMRNYLVRLGLDLDGLLALGRAHPGDPGEALNMAHLAIRGSGAVNAVSRLHGEVSRRLFQPLFPGWPGVEVPVGHVTNGVHTPSWASAEADRLVAACCGTSSWLGDEGEIGRTLCEVSDGQLWEFRAKLRGELIAYARERFARQRGAEGASLEEIAEAGEVLDPNALTLGFARRFATYKRPNLLLHDPERLVRLLTDPHRPVQIVIAGKAHPHDAAGKAMVQAWVRFSHRPEVRRRVVFLGDYDMMLTEHMVQGVDVWVNTPRRPWEASGTSGMKVLINGGLNLSSLDGWWAEAHAPEVGWALGDERGEHDGGDDPVRWDAREAEALYRLLEREVVPAFYDGRDDRGVPTGWVARVRPSMARLTPRFSASRMVREYAERYYLPAAAAYRARWEGQQRPGAELEAWRSRLAAYWGEVRFGEVRTETADGRHRVQAHVYLGELDPDSVAVELYADPVDGGGDDDAAAPVREVMQRGERLAGAVHGYAYSAAVPADRPSGHYTPRVVPHHPQASVPLEAAQILWYR